MDMYNAVSDIDYYNSPLSCDDDDWDDEDDVDPESDPEDEDPEELDRKGAASREDHDYDEARDMGFEECPF